MGKRKGKHQDEEVLKKKMKKLERKLEKYKEKKLESSNLGESSTRLSPLPESERGPSPVSHTTDVVLEIDKDELPEEFLLALGNEGEEMKEIGMPIQSELAVRWSRIMSSGLGKESRELIMKKYPIPENFPRAVPPEMNPEMLASISEVSVKRDRRITSQQQMTGKIMSCLGKALTSILKGNINTKDLVEQVNDAAKLAGEMYYQDSTTRKFFALATAEQTVKEAIRNEKPDEFLFGKDCAEKIKTAQSIKKTGTQIRVTSTASKSFRPKKHSQGGNKNQGNWRGPPRNQQQSRGRGRHRQQMKRHYIQTQKDRRRPFQPRQQFQYKGTYQQ